MNAPYYNSKSHCDVICGLEAPGAMVSIPPLQHSWCLHQSGKCKAWKQIDVWGDSIPTQASVLTMKAFAHTMHK